MRVQVATKLAARNLARVRAGPIEDAYASLGPSSLQGGEQGGWDAGSEGFQRRPRRSSQELGGGSAAGGTGGGSPPAAVARVWSFDGRAASVRIQAVAAQATPLALLRAGTVARAAVGPNMAVGPVPRGGGGGGGGGGGSGKTAAGGGGPKMARAGTAAPLKPMGSGAKAGGKGSPGGTKTKKAGPPLKPKRRPVESGPAPKPGGVPSRNKKKPR